MSFLGTLKDAHTAEQSAKGDIDPVTLLSYKYYQKKYKDKNPVAIESNSKMLNYLIKDSVAVRGKTSGAIEVKPVKNNVFCHPGWDAPQKSDPLNIINE